MIINMGVDITIKLFLNKNKEEILKIILNQTEELQELYMEVKNSLNEETIKLIKNNGGTIKENMLGKSKLCTFNVNKENCSCFRSSFY